MTCRLPAPWGAPGALLRSRAGAAEGSGLGSRLCLCHRLGAHGWASVPPLGLPPVPKALAGLLVHGTIHGCMHRLSWGPWPHGPGGVRGLQWISLQPWVGEGLSHGWRPRYLPQQGARSPRGPGLSPGVCAQQTGSAEGDFSPMILCLPRRDPGSVSTQEAQEAGRGPGRNSLGWPRSQASCGQVCRVGGGGGDGAAKSSGRPLPTRNSGLGTLEGLCPPAP